MGLSDLGERTRLNSQEKSAGDARKRWEGIKRRQKTIKKLIGYIVIPPKKLNFFGKRVFITAPFGLVASAMVSYCCCEWTITRYIVPQVRRSQKGFGCQPS